MDSERRILLVDGIHPGITPIPEAIAKGDFPYRLGLVLDSYRSSEPEMFFDSELFVELIDFISATALGPPKAIDMESVPLREGSLDGLRECYASTAPGDRDLPRRIDWEQAVGFSEYWNLVGGPAPYHDSFTFSIFSRQPLHPILEDALPRFIRERGWACDGWIRVDSPQAGNAAQNRPDGIPMRQGGAASKAMKRRIPAIAAVALFIAAQVLLFLGWDNEQKPTTKTLPIAAIACLAGSVALGLLALRHANRE